MKAIEVEICKSYDGGYYWWVDGSQFGLEINLYCENKDTKEKAIENLKTVAKINKITNYKIKEC